ncbi:MAG: four helix bundle protein, partial [Thermomicrobia bacterium]|nr:four helix bundle protein [Thermomicrobia bacterium]
MQSRGSDRRQSAADRNEGAVGRACEEARSCPVRITASLFAWHKTMGLVESVYRVMHDWPKEEMYRLANEMRRAVVSVPANMAEGARTQQRERVCPLSLHR